MIIYKVTNKINGKVYIGQTIQPLSERWRKHSYSKKMLMARVINKYGKENFTIEQIDSAASRDELDLKEQYWINFYDSMNHDKGYNLTSGGGHCEVSETSKKKRSEALKGRFVGELHPMYGIPRSDEVKRKCREAVLGRVFSEETRKKMSEAAKHKSEKQMEALRKVHERQKGVNHPSYGKPRSKESKIKQREAMLGKLVGDKNPHTTAVRCIETGEVFTCIIYASKKHNVSKGGISAVCSGRQKTAGGLHWEKVNKTEVNN